MAEIVLRVRLIAGERLDMTYDEGGGAPDELVERVISILAEDNGALRCRHGGRLIVLYGRGVATLEVAPAVLSCDDCTSGAGSRRGARPGYPVIVI